MGALSKAMKKTQINKLRFGLFDRILENLNVVREGIKN